MLLAEDADGSPWYGCVSVPRGHGRRARGARSLTSGELSQREGRGKDGSTPWPYGRFARWARACGVRPARGEVAGIAARPGIAVVAPCGPAVREAALGNRSAREAGHAGRAPSAPVDLTRLASDVVTHAPSVHAPRRCPAAARTAAARQERVRAPGGPAGVCAGSPRRTGGADRAVSWAAEGVHARVSPCRGAARDGHRPRRGRRRPPSGRRRRRATRRPAPRPRRRWRRRSGRAARAHPTPRS